MYKKIRYLDKNFFIEDNDNLKLVQSAMCNNLDFTADVRNEIAKHLGNGKFMDIGANVGIVTVMTQGLYDEAVAIEPDTTNFELLGMNIRENGLSDRVRLVNCACGDTRGKTSLYISDVNDGDHRCLRTNNPDEKIFKNVVDDVRLETIDDICEELNFVPDVVKMDAQGCEMNILIGAKNVRPVYVMEYWPHGLHECGHRGKDIADWCEDNDYICGQRLLELEDINHDENWFIDITLIPKNRLNR